MKKKNKVKCPYCNKYIETKKCKCGATYVFDIHGFKIWRKQL
jgi:hypothetical protein